MAGKLPPVHIKRPLTQRLYERFVHKYWGRDLKPALDRVAREETVDYIRQHMTGAMLFPHRWALIAYALEKSPAEGLYAEFGVADGASVNHAAQWLAGKRPGATIHGFDSFEGLPEDWTATYERRGKFSRGGALPAVEANARLHKGWFDATLPPFLADHPGPAAFIHIDCDLYSSTRTVLDLLAPRLVKGTVIVFDEYFNYFGWREHEFKAWQEFVRDRKLAYRYLGFATRNGHVAVVVD